MTDRSEWVSLGEAANILGVHPTTVRHWADSGDLPSQRTPGGHRRFRRTDLIKWNSLRERNSSPSEAQLMMQNALGRTRLSVGDGQLEGTPWYDQLDEEVRKTHRMMGRQLMELLTRYFADSEADESELLSEVRDVGATYGQLSLEQGLSLTEAVRAFLFFRDLLAESVTQLAEMLSLRTPLDWAERLRQVNRVTDELLMALIEQYETDEL
ncbi:MAG: helix-turn-helix domain-containing protein [Chloroflexi bacterium]|nr:helix-turn-helix domain-containing protein [Chloroflexota bacterium]